VLKDSDFNWPRQYLGILSCTLYPITPITLMNAKATKLLPR